MGIPKFNAESALGKASRTYRGSPRFGSFSQSGVPAVAVQPSQFESEVLDDVDDAGLDSDEMYAGETDTDDSSEGDDNGEGEGEAFEESGEEVDEG